MRKLSDISLERKLKLITMLASGAALLLACVGIVTYEFFSYRRALTREVGAVAELVGGTCALSLNLNYKKDADEFLGALVSSPNITAACIYDKQGNEFARYVRDGLTFIPPSAGPLKHEFSDSRLKLFAPIVLRGEQIGTIYIESDLVELNARLRGYATSVLVLMFAALGVAYVLSTKLQKVISGPLLRLAETARVVSKDKNYSVRAPKTGNDELGQLIDGFNEMLAQIQRRDDALHAAQGQLEKRVEERTSELQLEVQERKQAERVVQQQLARISLLNQITHAISERQDVNSILSIVLHQVEQHLTVCCGAFYLYDGTKESLQLSALRAGRSHAECPFARELKADDVRQSELRNALRGTTVYLPEAGNARVPLLQNQFNGSLVIVPLTVESKLFGWLVTGRADANAFSSGECEFLKMLSEQVALAGHHAQLYTQLQGAYDELRQTQQAVMQHERLRALGQLASGIAHDINNALSPVMGFAELLLNSETTLTPRGVKYLNHIRTSSEDIAHIVSRLKEFYRQREEAHELKPVQLNDLAQQVIDLTRPRWRDMSQERGIYINVTTDLVPILPPMAGIESELREALTNLILNAVDALPGGGTISVRTRIIGRIPNRTDSLPSEVVLEVSDNGVGMTEETRKRCLEPFYSTKGTRGTGLGLAMVYGIMERHDGRIEIESAPGKGTTMRLIFPVGERLSLTSGTGSSDSQAVVRALKILFVDDEPLLRQLVGDMLRTDGHNIEVADGGQEGLAMFRAAITEERPFDVVITDLGMPGLDGRKLTSLLKQESPRTPVIMLTGWGALMRKDGDTPLHVECVLSKPPRLNDLRGALRDTMARHQ